MKIINPLQMNDWEIKKFLTIVLIIQLTLWAVIGLDVMGLQIPIVRQFIGFIYLTFIPGIILLRVLRLHKLGNIETLLYTVGLSIAALMFTGFFMNMVYSYAGILGPISITPLIITISVVVLLLCILSYVRDKSFSEPSFIEVKDMLSPPALFLCLIPFLAIFGTYLVNFHHNNIILMFLIPVIGLTALLIAFDRFIPKNLYPLAVFVIALALLYHNSLISMYIWGWDIHSEYPVATRVVKNSIWDWTIHDGCNAMLSLVILAPIYSIIMNMNLTWIFKILYPLLFSLVSFGLYQVYQKQTNDKIAFLSCFFFVSLFTFYTEMLSLARQEIAELFLVLLVLLMIDKNMDKMNRSFLFVAFGISLVVSHYGLSYLYLFSISIVLVMLVLMENSAMQGLRNNIYAKFSGHSDKIAGSAVSSNARGKTLSSTFVLLFIVFTLAWYIYVSSSATFDSIIYIGDHILSSILTDFLDPKAAQGLGIMLAETVSPLHEVTKYLHLLSQFFITVGILTLLVGNRYMKFRNEYVMFSLVNFLICVGCITVPYFASSLNTSRVYQITLIFLAPLCVIGGIRILEVMNKIVNPWANPNMKNSPRLLSLFLAIFLLFNSGFIYEVAKDYQMSISLSQESIKEYGSVDVKMAFYNSYLPEQDVFGARWLFQNRDGTALVYADYGAYGNVLQSYGGLSSKYRRQLSITSIEIETGSYLFMRYVNVIYGIYHSIKFEGGRVSLTYPTSDIKWSVKENCRIYSNGGGDVYVNN